MDRILKICQFAGIKISHIPGTICAARKSRERFASNQILIGDQVEHEETALWHETGHLMHPHGYVEDKLEAELAANTWALQNYEGDNYKEVLYWLRTWILTYIEIGGFKEAPAFDEYIQTAKKLDIYHLITWVYPRDFRHSTKECGFQSDLK